MKFIDRIIVKLFGRHHWHVVLTYYSNRGSCEITQGNVTNIKKEAVVNHRDLIKTVVQQPLHKRQDMNRHLLNNGRIVLSRISYLGRW